MGTAAGPASTARTGSTNHRMSSATASAIDSASFEGKLWEIRYEEVVTNDDGDEEANLKLKLNSGKFGGDDDTSNKDGLGTIATTIYNPSSLSHHLSWPLYQPFSSSSVLCISSPSQIPSQLQIQLQLQLHHHLQQ
jgi:hypothetical protein